MDPLNRLPIADDEWQAAVFMLDPERGESTFCLCVSRELGVVIDPIACDGPDDVVEATLAAIEEFACHPQISRLPRLLRVNSPAAADALRKVLPDGVTVEQTGNLPIVASGLRELLAESNCDDGPLPPYLGGPSPIFSRGVSVDDLAAFAAAGAAFWDAAPWERVDYDVLFRVRRPKPKVGMAHFSIMGQSRGEYGLSFYHRRADFDAMLDSEHPADLLAGGAGPSGGVSFDRVADMNLFDAEMWEQHKLALSDDGRRFPSPIVVNESADVVRPTAVRLRYLTELLAALANATPAQFDAGRIVQAGVEVEIV